jgi:prefoldin subunit 5
MDSKEIAAYEEKITELENTLDACREEISYLRECLEDAKKVK